MGLWARLRRTFHGGRHSLDIQEELQFHLDMDVADGRDRRDARLRLGNMTRIAEDTRAVGVIEWLDSILQDARYGLRQLRKAPVLVLAIVLSLTIGIGANTAIFSLVDAALLKPLPVNDPTSLRIIEWTNDGFPEWASNINGDFSRISDGRVQASSIAASTYRNLARQQPAFESLIGVADPNAAAIVVDGSPAAQVNLQYVSSNFFQGLGIAPVIGRPFREEEDRVGQEPVVIVSHRFWSREFARAADAVGRTLRVNNVVARIVGVAPRGFFGLRAGEWTDVYAPLATRVVFVPDRATGAPLGEDDGDWWVRQVGRLKPDVPEEIARTEIAGLFRKLAVPDGVTIDSKKIPTLITLPGRRGFNTLNPMDANALRILMLLVGILLLLVCANVANLLLSRSVSRQRESAVRLALGAARTRLFRQHLIESGIFALLGSAAGLVMGYLLAQSIHALFQAGRDPGSAFDLHVDPRVLGYTAALSVLTALLFGLAPATRAAHADLNDALKAHGRSVIRGRLRLPRLLVILQIALCLTALVAAGLLGRSLRNLKQIDVGFVRENLAYVSVNPWQAGYSAERVSQYIERVRDELAKLPVVLGVSPVQVRLLSGNGNLARVSIPGRHSRVETGIVDMSEAANLNDVGEAFFETMHIPVLAGRTFERADIRANAAAVVVDRQFARRFFPDVNPLGRRFGFNPKENTKYEIVGIVGDTLYNSLRTDPLPTIYRPFVPGTLGGPVHFAIRTRSEAGRLADMLRTAVNSADPAVPLTGFHTQTNLIDRLLRTERLLGFLSGAFAVIALTLAAIGLGGLLSYAVARRTNEVGVRMALGAAAGDVIRMVLRDSLGMVCTGILVGLPSAFVIGKILKSALFRLEPFDPRTATLSLVALLSVALVAAWMPARKAASIDPMIALRQE